jgi:hypothetical protein
MNLWENGGRRGPDYFARIDSEPAVDQRLKDRPEFQKIMAGRP